MESKRPDSIRKRSALQNKSKVPISKAKTNKIISKQMPRISSSLQALIPPSSIQTFNDDQEFTTKQIIISEQQKQTEAPISLSLSFAYQQLQLSQTSQQVPCMITLQSIDQSIQSTKKSRSGLDLVCVIDISGSMNGQKIELVKSTLQFMTTVLGQHDRLSLVLFQSRAYRLCPLTTMNDRGKMILNNHIKGIRSNGGTQIELGLQTGIQVLRQRRKNNQVSSILLLTDGCDNNAATINQRIERLIRQTQMEYHTDFTVHTFGYGANHDANILQKISDENNGNFYYVEKATSIPDAFANCLGELVSLVADSPQISIQALPCMVPFELSKVYSDNGDTHFTMPQIFSSSRKDSVFLLRFDPVQTAVPDGQTIIPVRVTLRYVYAKTKVPFETEQFLYVTLMNRLEEVVINQDVMANFFRVKAADMLKEIAKLAEEGQFERSRELARAGAQQLENCVVANHELVHILKQDFVDAMRRVQSSATWEQGGRAQVTSLKTNHMKQKAASNCMQYQNRAQVAYTHEAKLYFKSRHG